MFPFKGTKAITMLLAIVFIFGLIANCGSPIMAEEAVSEQKDFLKILNFDPEEMPKSSKSVVFLQGSWYEMGYQYGTQVPDVVKREAAIGLAKKINNYGYNVASKEADYYIEHYQQHMPELLPSTILKFIVLLPILLQPLNRSFQG